MNKEYIVTKNSGLLESLIENIKDKSRNNIKAILKNGEVMVDGRIVKQFDHPLSIGQKISIKKYNNRDQTLKTMLDILYEDDEIIVINKPAGLLTVATEKDESVTVYHMLTKYVKLRNSRNRAFIVHRLDRDTSGVLLAAKNEEIRNAFQDRWDELALHRGYIAVVEGAPDKDKGIIRSFLKQGQPGVVFSTKESEGKEAITEYAVIKENESYAMLEISLHTGRKNQIRVHMKEMGHSVVGDKKYGATGNPMKRLGLHAHKLIVKHPFSGEEMCFEAKTPKEFNKLV